MIMRRLSPLIVVLALGATMVTPAASAHGLLSAHAVHVSLPATGNPQGDHNKKPPHDPNGQGDCYTGSPKGHGKDPACQAPEAPAAIGLPLTALIIFGGYVLVMRRRDDRDTPAAAIQS